MNTRIYKLAAKVFAERLWQKTQTLMFCSLGFIGSNAIVGGVEMVRHPKDFILNTWISWLRFEACALSVTTWCGLALGFFCYENTHDCWYFRQVWIWFKKPWKSQANYCFPRVFICFVYIWITSLKLKLGQQHWNASKITAKWTPVLSSLLHATDL